jgi:Protein of unknown function (DUF2735)
VLRAGNCNAKNWKVDRTMTTVRNRETAKIYQFPISTRAPAVRSRENGERSPSVRVVGPASIDFGECWYHAAAIAHDEVPRKR